MARRRKRGGASANRMRGYIRETDYRERVAGPSLPTHPALKLRGVGVVRASVSQCIDVSPRGFNPHTAFGITSSDRGKRTLQDSGN